MKTTQPTRTALRAASRSGRFLTSQDRRSSGTRATESRRRSRVFREARRGRRLERLARIHRLLEIQEVDPLLNEIVRCVLHMTRARRVELQLESNGELCAREALRTPRRPHVGRRLALALRHGDQRVAILRVVDPMHTRMRELRGYLDVAGGAVAMALRLQQAQGGIRRYEALVSSFSDICLLVLGGSGRVLDMRGGSASLRERLSAPPDFDVACESDALG